MFKNYLLEAKDKKNVVSIYNNPEDIALCYCGFVAGITDDDVLIAAISPVGLYDGFILMKCKDIFRVDKQDQYAEKILKLYYLREQKHSVINLKTGHLITDLAQFALDNHLVSTPVVLFCLFKMTQSPFHCWMITESLMEKRLFPKKLLFLFIVIQKLVWLSNY